MSFSARICVRFCHRVASTALCSSHFSFSIDRNQWFGEPNHCLVSFFFSVENSRWTNNSIGFDLTLFPLASNFVVVSTSVACAFNCGCYAMSLDYNKSTWNMFTTLAYSFFHWNIHFSCKNTKSYRMLFAHALSCSVATSLIGFDINWLVRIREQECEKIQVLNFMAAISLSQSEASRLLTTFCNVFMGIFAASFSISDEQNTINYHIQVDQLSHLNYYVVSTEMVKNESSFFESLKLCKRKKLFSPHRLPFV